VIGVYPGPLGVIVFAKVLSIRKGYGSRRYRNSSGLSSSLYVFVKAS
jgi:hypothetical protein